MKRDIITEASLIVRNNAIPSGEIDGEMVALDLDRGDCFGLDRVGTVIWALAAQPVRVAQVLDRLVGDYEVDRATCAADVLPFLAALGDAGLVRVIEG